MKGQTEIYFTILQILIVGVAFTYLMIASAPFDLASLQRTGLAVNTGLLISTTSFLPGTIHYHFNEGPFSYGDFSKTSVKYGLDPLDNIYSFWINNIQFNTQKVELNNMIIKKSNEINLEESPVKLYCKGEQKDYPFSIMFGGEENAYYYDGRKIHANVEISYEGMEKIYTIEGKRVYKGKKDEMYEHVNKINKIKNVFIPLEEKEKSIILTESDENHIIAYIPEEDYSTACNIINNMLDVTLIADSIDGFAIIPHHKKHIIIEISEEITNKKNMEAVQWKPMT